MQLVQFFDQRRCNGCHTCTVACKEWHGVPAGSASWRRVVTIEKGQFPELWAAHLSLACYHCSEPACVPSCPTKAIVKRDDDGIVVVDRDLCVSGCRACSDACPYDAPQFRAADSKMEKCDLCLDRIETGKEPMCVATCPLRALKVGPLDEIMESCGGEEWAPGLPALSQTKPSVVFRPRPGFD